MRSVRTIALYLAGAVCALAASTATAQELDPTGPYISLGAGGAFETFDDSPLEFSHAPAFSPRAGWRVSQTVGLEVQYEHSGDFNDDTELADLVLQSVTANAKVYPINRLLQPYALLGMGFLHSEVNRPRGTDTSDEDVVFRFGLGLEAYTDSILSFYLESTYLVGFDGIEDIDHAVLSAGLIIRFGGEGE